MPVNVYTSDNDRIVHMDYVDPWTLSDYLASVAVQQAVCNKLTGPVTLIVDLRGTSHVPPGIIRARESPLLRDKHLSTIIAVGGPVAAQFLGEAVLRLARYNKAHFVKTLEQAMDLIHAAEPVPSTGSGVPIA